MAQCIICHAESISSEKKCCNQLICEACYELIDSCPICRTTLNKINFNSQVTNLDPNDVRCEICNEEEASVYCLQCNQFYCSDCQISHNKMKFMKNHQFVEITDQTSLDAIKKNQEIKFCPTHLNFELDAYDENLCKIIKSGII